MTSPPFPTWTTVTIGSLQSPDAAIDALRRADIVVPASTLRLLHLIPYEQVERSVPLVYLPGTAIGQRGSLLYRDFKERAEKQALTLVPPEVGVALWLQRRELVMSVRRPFLMMEAYAGETGLPMIFTLVKVNNTTNIRLYLKTSFGHDNHQFYGGRCWVFQQG